MLRSIKGILNCRLLAQDGEFGTVEDMYVDRKGWAIQYLVVKTGDWLPGSKLLLPFSMLSGADWLDGLFPMPFTRSQVLKKYVRDCMGKYVPFGVTASGGECLTKI
jgi:hypothetical protein